MVRDVERLCDAYIILANVDASQWKAQRSKYCFIFVRLWWEHRTSGPNDSLDEFFFGGGGLHSTFFILFIFYFLGGI